MHTLTPAQLTALVAVVTHSYSQGKITLGDLKQFVEQLENVVLSEMVRTTPPTPPRRSTT